MSTQKDDMKTLSIRIQQSEIDRAEELVEKNLRDPFTGYRLGVVDSNNRSTIVRTAIQLGLLVLEKAPHGFCSECGCSFKMEADVWATIKLALAEKSVKKRLCKVCALGGATIEKALGTPVQVSDSEATP